MKNYEELFHERFDKGQKIDNTFVDICNVEGLKNGIKYLQEIGATCLMYEDFHIKYALSQWTKNTLASEEKREFLNDLKRFKDYVIDVDIETNNVCNLPEVVITTKEGEVRALQFSAIVPQVKEFFPFIETDERFGKCYDFAYNISLNLGKANEIVTGYIYGYSDKAEFLHSWVEVTLRGEEYVIDGTLNAMINKKGYYLMQHAKPINRISDDTLRSDIKNYLASIERLPLEVYYVFRDEIVKDLKKNKEVFGKK